MMMTMTMRSQNNKPTTFLLLCWLLASRIAATGLRGATESEDSGSFDPTAPLLHSNKEEKHLVMMSPVQDNQHSIPGDSNSSHHLVAVEDPVLRDAIVLVRSSGATAGAFSNNTNGTTEDPLDRHLAGFTVEYHTVLIVRINNPTVSEVQMRNSVFIDVKRQMELCSQGVVRILPPRFGLPTVLNVGISMSVTNSNMDAFADLAQRAAEQQLNNRYNLRDVADHILFVLPYIPDFTAKGELGMPRTWRAGAQGYTTKYSAKYAPSLSILMHEIVSRPCIP